MTVKEMIKALSSFKDDDNVFIENVNINCLKDKNNRLNLDNNFILDDSDISDVICKDGNVYIKPEYNLVTIPTDYFYYLIWREQQNDILNKRLHSLLSSCNDEKIICLLKDFLKEDKVDVEKIVYGVERKECK